MSACGLDLVTACVVIVTCLSSVTIADPCVTECLRQSSSLGLTRCYDWCTFTETLEGEVQGIPASSEDEEVAGPWVRFGAPGADERSKRHVSSHPSHARAKRDTAAVASDVEKRAKNFVRIGRGDGENSEAELAGVAAAAAGRTGSSNNFVSIGSNAAEDDGLVEARNDEKRAKNFVRIGRGDADAEEVGDEFFGLLGSEKRAKNFVRIGRGDDKRAKNFVRIGRDGDNWDWERFQKRAKNFVRIGRGSDAAELNAASAEKRAKNFVRIGRDGTEVEHNEEKRAKNFVRIGRGDVDTADVTEGEDQQIEGGDNEVDVDKRGKSFVRIGRGDDKRAKNFVRIGRGKNFVRIGRGDEKRAKNFVRIGRGKNFVRIGRDGLKRGKSFVRIGRSTGDNMLHM